MSNKTIKLYQVDAFTDKVFSGNPAAVCPLDGWLDDDIMQNIAQENNLAETVFYVKENDTYTIRWFTPTVEVDLCGHATLAAAFVLFHIEKYDGDVIHFHSPRSGPLSVKKEADSLILDFPADIILPIELTPTLSEGFSTAPKAVYKGKTDYMFVFGDEDEILDLKPNLNIIEQWPVRGVIVTSPGKKVDFVSRFFGPQSGVPEDPVTGSAHTTLTPYWSSVLGKDKLTAIQLSKRKGHLTCKNLGSRVEISGQAKLYLQGEIYIE